MAIFFGSDHHFYHANVIKYCDRPFSSVEEMNEIMIQRHNETVGPDDDYYHVGDFAMAIRPVETITPRLNGRKILIAGNHDWCHSYNKKSRGERGPVVRGTYYNNGWTHICEQMSMELEPKLIVDLCHLPFTDDRAFPHDKYAAWRPKDNGRWLLHGHTHSKERFRTDLRMVHVGVDAWDFRPVPLATVVAIIKGEFTNVRG